MPSKEYFKSFGLSDEQAEQLAGKQDRGEAGFFRGLGRGVAETGASYAGGFSFLDEKLTGGSMIGRALDRTSQKLSEPSEGLEFTGAGKAGRAIGRVGSELAGALTGGGLAVKGATKFIPGFARALGSGSRARRAGAQAAASLPIDAAQALTAEEGGLALPGRGGAFLENVALSGAAGALIGPTAKTAKKTDLSKTGTKKVADKAEEVLEDVAEEQDVDQFVPSVARSMNPDMLAYAEDVAKDRASRIRDISSPDEVSKAADELDVQQILKDFDDGVAQGRSVALGDAQQERLIRELDEIKGEIAATSARRTELEAKKLSGTESVQELAELNRLDNVALPTLYAQGTEVAIPLSLTGSAGGRTLQKMSTIKALALSNLVDIGPDNIKDILKANLGIDGFEALKPKDFKEILDIFAMPDKSKQIELIDSFVNRLTKMSKAEVALENRRAGLLSMPASWLRNLLGSGESGAGTFVETPIAKMLDRLMASNLDQERVFGNAGILDGAKDYLKGFSQGSKEIWKNKERYLAGLGDPETPLAKIVRGRYSTAFESEGAKKAANLLNRINNGIYGIIAAGDKPFFEAAMNQSLKERALMRALRDVETTKKGIKAGTPEFDRLVRDYMDLTGQSGKVVDDDIVFATFDALDATYKSRTAFGEAVREQQKKGGVAGKALSFLIPFPNTPTNIIRKALERVPIIGLGVGGYGNPRLLKRHVDSMRKQGFNVTEKGLQDQARRMEAMLYAKQITGSTAVFMGYALHKSGVLTTEYTPPIGASSGERREAQRRELTGEGPLSIRFGGNSYNLASLGTIAPLLAIGASLSSVDNEMEGEPLFTDLTGAAGSATIRAAAEMPLLTGVRDALETIEGRGLAKDAALGRAAATFIPLSGAGRAASQFVETDVRKPETFVEGVLGNLPYASKSLPKRVTTLGETLDSPDPINRALNPLTPRSMVSGPLYEALEEIDYIPGSRKKDTDETYRDFSARRQTEGADERERLERIIAAFEEYTGTPVHQLDPVMREALKRALDKSTTKVRAKTTRRRRALERLRQM